MWFIFLTTQQFLFLPNLVSPPASVLKEHLNNFSVPWSHFSMSMLGAGWRSSYYVITLFLLSWVFMEVLGLITIVKGFLLSLSFLNRFDLFWLIAYPQLVHDIYFHENYKSWRENIIWTNNPFSYLLKISTKNITFNLEKNQYKMISNIKLNGAGKDIPLYNRVIKY